MNLWDYKANFYDLARNLFPFNLILKREIENLKELISEIHLDDKKILDVGSGTGAVLRLFPNKARIYATDSSLKMLEIARQRHRFNFVVADSGRLPFISLAFDLVSAVGVFEYQKKPLESLQALQRVLDPDGFMILTYSQKGILNYLRNLLGHRVYLQSYKNFNLLLKRTGLGIKKLKKSLLQVQVLLHKTNAAEISPS